MEEAKGKEEEEQVWSWGAGTDGQLGTGKLEDELLPQPLHLPFLEPISALSCGGAHVIALTSSGQVLTWGRGTSGQLGHANMLSCLLPKPLDFFHGSVITHVSAGWTHSGFVSDRGCVFTCGDGSFGQLGHADYTSHASPLQISYFAKRHVHQIACGMRHSLVLLNDCSGSQVYGFGSTKRGQLGITNNDKMKFTCIPELTCGFEDTEINSIYANGDHSAALSADRHLYIWGRGFPGTRDVFSPQRLVSSLQFIKVALGWNHALALTVEGEVFILGGDRHGALGDLEKISRAKHLTESAHAVLVRVSSLDGVKVVDIAAGSEHSALLTVDGAVRTWGWGEHGQLGLGNTKDQTSPLSVCLGCEAENKNFVLKVYCGSGFTFSVRSLSPSQN